jgi:uncharacterized protein (TIGR02246 family)
MRNFLMTVTVIGVSCAICVGAAQESKSLQKKAAAKPAAKAEAAQGGATQKSLESDEVAIHANVEAFAKAYNKGDAKAVAALFGPNAQVIDEDENTVQGRDAIEQVFARIFQETPESQIEVTIDSLKFVGTALAVETGRAKVIPVPGEAPEQTRYTVLHVKQDGKWLMALARDTAGESVSIQDRLKPLEFLVGEWVNEGGSAVVFTSCRWDDSKKFVLQDIKVRMEGRDAMQVSQRFGWDPLTKRIKSWVFDSEGGYGETVWTRDGNRWIGKATGVRSDGATASATNIIIPTGRDSYLWHSADRIVGDDVEAPVEVKVVRKPPKPFGASASK